jgi:hypothetical protein
LKTVIIDTGGYMEFFMHLSTCKELRSAVGPLRLKSSEPEITFHEVIYRNIKLKLKYPAGNREVEPILNLQGTAIGIPGFQYFGDVFVLNTRKKNFEFVQTSCHRNYLSG